MIWRGIYSIFVFGTMYTRIHMHTHTHTHTRTHTHTHTRTHTHTNGWLECSVEANTINFYIASSVCETWVKGHRSAHRTACVLCVWRRARHIETLAGLFPCKFIGWSHGWPMVASAHTCAPPNVCNGHTHDVSVYVSQKRPTYKRVCSCFERDRAPPPYERLCGYTPRPTCEPALLHPMSLWL